MPYVSDAQRKYFNVNRDKLEKQGVDVGEWNAASKGKKLPEHVKKPEGIGHRIMRIGQKKESHA